MTKESSNIRFVPASRKGINITVGELYNSSLPKQFKICKNYERFWVEPTNVKYKVKVCNDLTNINLKIGDIIKISPRSHVYDVLPAGSLSIVNIPKS